MKWSLALDFARTQTDVTYEEWCNLYVNMAAPTEAQVKRALETAHPILVRNGVIEESVMLSHNFGPKLTPSAS